MTSTAGSRSITIAERAIGPDYPTYVIAEMSANHAGSFEEAAYLVRAAARAGVDCVKLQTYSADTMTVDVDTPLMRIGEGSPWQGRNLYQLYAEASMPWEWQGDLRAIALAEGIELFSTAFDRTAVEFLEGLGVPAHKVASFEIVDHELISDMARTGKPLIISTGAARLDEIAMAVEVARANGAREIALLKCTSTYPAPPQDLNLRAIPVLSDVFDVPTGFSDHSTGVEMPIAAVALGACIVEKHFARAANGSTTDGAFSLGVEELARMVGAIRRTEAAMGSSQLRPAPSEEAGRAFRRSLHAIADITPGDAISRKNIAVLRPGHGIEPRFLDQVLGRTASSAIAAGHPVRWESLQ